MSDELKKAPPQIRTFAGDLSIQREKRGRTAEPTTTEKDVPAPAAKKVSEPAPMLASMAYDEPRVVTPKKHPAPELTIPTPKKETSASANIPAFHELKRHTETKHEEPKSGETINHSTKNKRSSLDRIGLDSTVITDTKAKRFKLFPSIVESVKSWFKKISTNHKKKKIPTYTVSDANHRKGVIQKATSKTGTIFTADNETLREQIRRRQKIAEEMEKPETTWSPYTETGYNLIEAPDTTANVVVEFKKHATAVQEPIPQEAVEPVVEEVFVKEVAEYEQESPVQPDEETETTYEEPTSVIPPENESSEPEEEEEPQVVEKYNQTTGLIDRMDTNALTVTLLIVLVSLAAIFFLVRIVINEVNKPPLIEDVPTLTTESVLSDTQLVSILLTTENLTQLPQLIRTAITSAPDGVVELPIISSDGNEILASYLFETLQFNVAPSLQQSITSARFATVNQSKPILIIQFVDKDTVLGGMLTWEEVLVSDLRNLYSLPAEVTEVFTDKKISETDIRSLVSNGDEIIVYGFIGKNTLIIAPNTSVFTQLSESGFSN